MIYKYIKNILNKFTTQTVNESDTDSSSVRSDSSSNKPNYFYVRDTTVDTINIKQKSKNDNFIIMHTKPDTTININIEQNSDKNNYIIINPIDSENKDIPQNNGRSVKKGDTHHNTYVNSTHNDGLDTANVIMYNKDITLEDDATEIQSEVNKALTSLKQIPRYETKNEPKNEPKDDDGKSGGNGLSGSGSISGSDSGNESSSAGPSNFKTFLDNTFIILINFTASLLDTINEIFTLM